MSTATNKADAFKKALNFGAIFLALRKGWDILKNITMSSVDVIETTNLFEVQMGKVVDEYGNLDEAQSQYYTKAMAFQDKMNEKLGTNKAEMEKYQAMYYGMLNSQLGAKNRDASYMMSESLTKAGYDIASLYNLDVETAMNKLKSGLAGQIESLRQIGIDVSEASLAKVLDQVGIDRSVQQLSYAEKEVARYIAICQQAGSAQGDFARTFETPANQIRVFKNQLAELSQVAGSFFVGIFGKIMPYVNGIIMAIKEVLKALASLFGFDLDLGSSGSSTLSSGVGSVADSAGTAGDNLGKATKQAKEFKKQLMGFDEINNIEPPTESASGGSGKGSGGGGISGGVDPALLNALKEWDNMMDKINGKAQQIRDAILDWLGVTDGTFANLKRIWEVVQMIGIAFATWKVAKAITDLLKNLGILNQTQAFQIAFGLTLLLTGLFAQYKGTKRLLEGDVNLFSILETLFGTGAGALGIASLLRAINKGKAFKWGEGLKIGFGIMLAIQGVQVFFDGINKGDIKKTVFGAIESVVGSMVTVKTLLGNTTIRTALTKLGTWFTTLGTTIKTFAVNSIGNVASFGIAVSSSFKDARANGASFGQALRVAGADATSFIGKAVGIVAGLAGMAGGTYLAYDAMKDLANGTKDSNSAMLELAGGMATATAGGALLGFQLGGPLGGAIGALTGLALSAIGAIVGLNSGFDSTGINEYCSEVQELNNSIKESIDTYKNEKQAIDDNLNSKLVELEADEKLVDKLGSVVDANGKVKKGYEEQADIILGELSNALGIDLKRNGEVITKNGEVVHSLQDLQGEMKNTIAVMKEKAKQEALTEKYKKALEEQIELENKQQVLREKSVELQEKYAEKTKGMAQWQQNWLYNTNADFKNLVDTMNTTSDQLNEMTTEYSANNRTIMDCEKELFQTTQETSNGITEANQQVADSSQQTAEQVKLSLDQLSADMITSGQVTQEQFATMITEGGDKLREMVQNDVNKWNELYAVADEAQKASMLAQSTTLDTWSPQLQEKWKTMATNSSTEYQKALEGIEPYTKVLIEATTNGVSSLTPENMETWKKMATDSHDNYIKALENVDDETKLILQSAIDNVNNLSPEQIEQWTDMAEQDNTKYNNALKSIGGDTAKYIQDAVNATRQKRHDAENAMKETGEGEQREHKSGLGDGSSSAEDFFRGFIKIAQGNPLGVFDIIKGVGKSICSFFNKGLDEHSPSKETMKSAKNFIKGFTNQIGIMEDDTLKQVQELGQNLTTEFDNSLGTISSRRIKINPNSFSVDANQFIDYGAINGQIKSNVSINGNITKEIGQASYDAFVKAMQDEGIHIEARTDEGVIFKKVQNSAREYTMQTGEPAFDY